MSFVYITDETAYIKKQNNTYLVTQNDEIKLKIPSNQLEGLVIFDKVQISSQALVALLRQGVFVTWLSSTGEYVGRLESPQFVNVSKQKQQLRLTDNPEFCLQLAKKFVLAKINNSNALLYNYNRRRRLELIITNMAKMNSLKKTITNATEISKIRGYEGYIAKTYFEALSAITPDYLPFKKRSKQPPKDMFNSMLSLGYTLLHQEIQTTAIQNGLHPYFPFYHTASSGYPALAFDLIEEWRAPIIDSLVLALINNKQIFPHDFDKPLENGAVYLSYEGRKKFISAYNKKMLTINSYCGSAYSYRHTLNWQAKSLCQAILQENVDLYQPILMR